MASLGHIELIFMFWNRMAWQWDETLVEIRGTLADIDSYDLIPTGMLLNDMCIKEHINGKVQERRNSSALSLFGHVSCYYVLLCSPLVRACGLKAI